MRHVKADDGRCFHRLQCQSSSVEGHAQPVNFHNIKRVVITTGLSAVCPDDGFRQLR